MCSPAGDPTARFVIGTLAMAAVAALTLAAQADHQERRAAAHAGTAPPLPPLPAPGPPPPFVRPPVAGTDPRPEPQPVHAPVQAPVIPTPPRRPPPGYQLTHAAPASPVPRFGAGAKAQQLPWRLPAQPSPVPGIIADEARLGALTVRAASLIGPGHRCEDPAVVRQDAYRLGRDAAGEHLVVAVADGLSSSPRADLGATVAVSSAVATVVEQLRTGVRPDQLSAAGLFGRAAQRIRDEAAARGLSDRDVCTLLIVAVLPTRFRGNESQPCWVGWIGDVSLWQHDGGRWRVAAGDPKQDDAGLASNALESVLPHDPDAARSCLLPLAPGDVLTLVTDGVGDGLAGLPALNGFLAREWAGPPAIADFINHIGYDAAQFTDDRTAVTVWADTANPDNTTPTPAPRWER
ncbi:protein phosphatase 2C domain-containing protein [Kitasatospora sp. NPDC058162]|uniref:protein phosphatase 2C domain-containing protein n=1 Tax=Kitasatospora sp. NPDC058162 TaxID=3346362 RepID=UPI0036DEFD68